MPFREHIDILKRTVVKAPKKGAKRGRKATAPVAVAPPPAKPKPYAELKRLADNAPNETMRRVYLAELMKAPDKPKDPPWQITHVIDPEWVKAYEKEHPRPAAVRDPFDFLRTWINNIIPDIFRHDLFSLDEPRNSLGATFAKDGKVHRKPGTEPDYKHLGQDLRDKLKDLLQLVVENAGVVLLEDEDQRAESLAMIEDKIRDDLNRFVKDCGEAAKEAVDQALSDDIPYHEIAAGWWDHYVEGGEIDWYIDSRRLFDVAVANMTSAEIEAALRDLRMDRIIP